MAANIKGITIEIDGSTKGLQKALREVDATIRDTQKDLREVDKLLKLDPGNTQLLEQKQRLLGESIKATKTRLEELKQAQSKVGEGTAEWDAIQREIVVTESKLDGLTDQMKEFGSVSAQKLKAVGDDIKDVGDKIKGAGEQMTQKVTVPIVAIAAASVAGAATFEDAMAKLSTIADADVVPLEELEAQIISLSNETGIAAPEIADNVYNAISAGQNTADAVNFVAESTKLATAGFADSGQALDLLTTILNAYGLEADEVTHVSDVLINTQNKGKTTVGELASAMGKIIPTANASNVSLEQLAAGYAIMTSNGIATAETTTYMNSMLNELGKSGTKASDELKSLTGKSFSELMERGMSVADVLGLLQGEADKSGMSLSDMFGSAEAGKAALTLLSGGVDEFNATVQSMQTSTGATDEAFGKLDTTSREAKIAINEVKNAGIDLGNTILEMLTPALNTIAEKIRTVTEWFSNLDDDQKKMIVTIGAVVAAIGPVLIIIGTLVGSIGTIVGAIGTVMGAFAALNPVVLGVIAVITILIGLGAALKLFWDENREKIIEFCNGVQEKWTAWVDYLKQSVEDTKTSVVNAWENIKQSVSDIVENVRSFIEEKWNNIKETISNAITTAKDTVATKAGEIKTEIETNVNAAIDFLKDLPSKALQWGKDLIGNFVDGIKEKWNALKDTVSDVAEGIADFLGFSEPEKGALSNFHEFAPDMMKLYAQGIKDNMYLVTDQMNALANNMAAAVQRPATIYLTNNTVLNGRTIASAVNEELGFLL